MGVNIDIWDRGDPPQPLEAWLQRWESPPHIDAPRRGPTARIIRFTELYAQALADAGIDLAETLPEMARGDRLEWWFDGDVVSVGKFIGPRASEALELAAKVAREAGAVPFMGTEEVTAQGDEPVFDVEPPPPGPQPPLTLYIADPAEAGNDPAAVVRRCGWASNTYGIPTPALQAFLDRLPPLLAQAGIKPGRRDQGETEARDGTQHYSGHRYFTQLQPPSPHDWVVASVFEGRHVLAVSIDSSATDPALIERLVREASDDLVVVDRDSVSLPPWIDAYLMPTHLTKGLTPERLTRLVEDRAPAPSGATAVVDAITSAFGAIELLPREDILIPDGEPPSVWFDPDLGSMAVEVIVCGALIWVTIQEHEEGFVEAVLSALDRARPHGWTLVTTQAYAAGLLPGAMHLGA